MSRLSEQNEIKNEGEIASLWPPTQNSPSLVSSWLMSTKLLVSLESTDTENHKVEGIKRNKKSLWTFPSLCIVLSLKGHLQWKKEADHNQIWDSLSSLLFESSAFLSSNVLLCKEESTREVTEFPLFFRVFSSLERHVVFFRLTCEWGCNASSLTL